MPDDLKKNVKKQVLSAADKNKILKEAKGIKAKLDKEAKKYAQAAKSKSMPQRTKEYYERASELVKQEAQKYTQKTIRGQFGKDAALNERLLFEAQFLKSFSRGSTATNVARRILTTRGEREEQERRTQAGARFYAGLKDVWVGKSYEDRDKAIVEFFGKRNLLEVMRELEEKTGVDLLNVLEDKEQYQNLTSALQAYISTMRNE